MGAADARQASISVAVRVRPFTDAESARLVRVSPDIFNGDALLLVPNTPYLYGIRPIVRVVDDVMLVFDPASGQPHTFGKPRLRDHHFVFDHVFAADASQQHVFERAARPLVAAVLDGYNGTIFAYGATGCGKTHTIVGAKNDPGVIERTAADLYTRIAELDTRDITVSVLYLEIYNETIRDLLRPETPHQRLVMREDAGRRVLVANLLVHSPGGVADIMLLVSQGNRNRTCLPTEANAASLRLHAVLQINVTLRERGGDIQTAATLLIIDLAGSERAASTRNRGARLAEGANINRLLLALGSCINALCVGRAAHVPYRDLKLTRLLKFSLGGNCKTVMIVCVAPLLLHYDETWNALQYADRAKHIKTKVVRNRSTPDRHVALYLKMIAEQRAELDALHERETSKVQAAVAAHAEHVDMCMDAAVASVAQLARAARRTPDRWRKAFLLAKRKLLLVTHQQAGCLVRAQVPRLVVPAEQLRHKLHDQIVRLERLYDALGDTDAMFALAYDTTLRHLEKSEGWTPACLRVYSRLVDDVRDTFHKDVLVCSSILFDYLVGALDDYDIIAKGYTRLVGGADVHAAEADVMRVLESMNSADYDEAIETRAAAFILAKLKEEDTDIANVDSFDHRNWLGSKILDLKPDLHLDKRHLSRNSLGSTLAFPHLVKPGDKRTSTSPLRSLRAFKTSKTTPDTDTMDADTSIDDSIIAKSDPDDDSPLGNRTVDKWTLLELDLNLSLNSPPMALPLKHFDLSPKVRTFAETALSPTGISPLTKFPLLNKLASTKVVHNGADELHSTNPS